MKKLFCIASLIFTALISLSSPLAAGIVLNPEVLEVPIAPASAEIKQIDHKTARKTLEEPKLQVSISEGSKIVHIYSLGFASAVAGIAIYMRRHRYQNG